MDYQTLTSARQEYSSSSSIDGGDLSQNEGFKLPFSLPDWEAVDVAPLAIGITLLVIGLAGLILAILAGAGMLVGVGISFAVSVGYCGGVLFAVSILFLLPTIALFAEKNFPSDANMSDAEISDDDTLASLTSTD